MSVEWAKLRAAELRELAAKGAIVVVPVASIEQHGPHLPVVTDTLLCSEVCRRAAEVVAKKFGISREAQDEYALRSHRLGAGSFALSRPICPLCVRRRNRGRRRARCGRGGALGARGRRLAGQCSLPQP